MYASEATIFPCPCPLPPPPRQNYTTTFYAQVILANGTNNAVANTVPVAGIQGKAFTLDQFGTFYVYEANITTTPSPNSTVIGKEYGTFAVVGLNGSVFQASSTYVFTSGKFARSTLTRVGIINLMQQVSYNPIVGGTNALTYATGYFKYEIVVSQPPYFVIKATANFELDA
ncbi:hypothetical protein MLD38_030508 [Melastoma candidum]|uniref:Uncharacterized protein n=1 Tax=Melastoma candidum TaxID=119954 RepID=A0ACB9MQG9_9MYRT|nr:hypothetical protein MLD38_030508 [Melastoma candidum]